MVVGLSGGGEREREQGNYYYNYNYNYTTTFSSLFFGALLRYILVALLIQFLLFSLS